MKTCTALVIAFLLSAAAYAEVPEAMLGTWENTTNGDVVGLKLYDEGKCDIYIERAYQNRTLKACKYEPFEQRFVVFLVKPDGSCASQPDFEFSFEPQAPLVHLFIQGSPINLSRAEQSPQGGAQMAD